MALNTYGFKFDGVLRVQKEITRMAMASDFDDFDFSKMSSLTISILLCRSSDVVSVLLVNSVHADVVCTGSLLQVPVCSFPVGSTMTMQKIVDYCHALICAIFLAVSGDINPISDKFNPSPDVSTSWLGWFNQYYSQFVALVSK